MSYFYRKSILIDQIIDDPSLATQDRERKRSSTQASLSLYLSET